MTLTSGRGPFSTDPAGRFNQELRPDLVYVEPFYRRVRAVLHGATVLDSEQVLLVHRTGQPPAYAFPANDVTGVASVAEPAAAGYVSVAWAAVEAWFEEEEEVFLHPRNPYHRVDCVRTTRHLRVEWDDSVLVDTSDTLGVYETALAPLLYVDPARVTPGLLAPSTTTTYCPYKGTASYWTATVGGRSLTDVAWSYEAPYEQCAVLRGLLGFDASKVRVIATLPHMPMGA
jgi:uncharacterized protein (DUF427 family)